MINFNDMIKYQQKTYSVPELAEKLSLPLEDINLVIATLNILEKQGKIEVIDTSTPEEKVVASAQKQEFFQQTVEGIQQEEDNLKRIKREQKLQEVDNYDLTLDFYQTLNAQKFDNWLSSIGITETKISKNLKSDIIELNIKNVTPMEYAKIQKKYTAENIINKSVDVTDRAVKTTTDSANYIATELVTPVAKIAGKGAMNLGKGLFHSAIKIGASLLNSGVQAVEETKTAMTTDPELLKASNQILNAKNTITRKVNHQRNKMGGSGIHINN
jgi:hypothetical protein